MTVPIVQLVADPFPPYQYEESGTVKGVDHDIITEAFKTCGFEACTLLLAWDVCMQSLNEGTADGIYQIAKTPERERQYLFSAALRTAKTSFYRLKRAGIDTDASIRFTPLDLGSLRIGVLAGYSYDRRVDCLEPSAKIEVENHEQLILGLREDRFELALMDEGVADYLISRHHITDIVPIEGYAIERELFVAFRKDRGDLARAFNAGLSHVSRTPIIQTIFERYGLHFTPTSRSS